MKVVEKPVNCMGFVSRKMDMMVGGRGVGLGCGGGWEKRKDVGKFPTNFPKFPVNFSKTLRNFP